VNNANAYSTRLIDQESVDELTDKCQNISKQWAKVTEELWKNNVLKLTCCAK